MEGVEIQQVGVSGDDGPGLAVNRDFKELVILGLAAGVDGSGNGDHASDAAEATHVKLDTHCD
jgi:hypothetical protein